MSPERVLSWETGDRTKLLLPRVAHGGLRVGNPPETRFRSEHDPNKGSCIQGRGSVPQPMSPAVPCAAPSDTGRTRSFIPSPRSGPAQPCAMRTDAKLSLCFVLPPAMQTVAGTGTSTHRFLLSSQVKVTLASRLKKSMGDTA